MVELLHLEHFALTERRLPPNVSNTDNRIRNCNVVGIFTNVDIVTTIFDAMPVLTSRHRKYQRI